MARNIKKEVQKHKERSYTNKDFKSLRNELRRYALTHFSDNVVDFSDSSMGGLILDLASYVGDVMTFYMDHQFNENSIENAVERNNIERLIRESGIEIPGAAPAYATIKISIVVPSQVVNGEHVPQTLSLPIIKRNSTFSTANGTEFVLLEDVDFTLKDDNDKLLASTSIGSLSGGNPLNFVLSANGIVSSSKIKTQTFTIEDKLVPFRTITLSQENVTEIISLVDTTGDTYYEVDTLSQDTVFKTYKNAAYDSSDVPFRMELQHAPKRFVKFRSANTGKTTLRFGSGDADAFDEDVIPDPSEHAIRLFGDRTSVTTVAIDPNSFLTTQTLGISPKNTTLTVTYRHGGGLSNNVSAGEITSIKTLITSFENATSPSIEASVRASTDVVNLRRASGGEDEPTLEELRNVAMFNRNAQNRIVTREDLITRVYSMPSNFGRVFRVAVADNPRNPRGAQLHIISRSSSGNLITSTDTLKQNLAKYLNKFRLVSDAIDILDAIVINLGVEYTITVEKGYQSSVVLAAIVPKLATYFGSNNVQINKPVIIGEIENIILNVPGVMSIISLNIVNKTGILDNSVYNTYSFDVKQNLSRGMLFPPIGGIFEVKFPNKDINGRVV
jgi:RNase P protein component